MFTNQTLLSLRSLQDLSDEARALHEKSNQEHRAENLYRFISGESQSELKQSCASLRLLFNRFMVEALQAAKPEFDDTPFAQTLEHVASGYINGAFDASLTLTLMLEHAREWLTAEAEKPLPKGKYRVTSSEHGEFTVDATSASKARLAAAEQHFGYKIDATNHNLLRGFSYGTREDEATTTLAD